MYSKSLYPHYSRTPSVVFKIEDQKCYKDWYIYFLFNAPVCFKLAYLSKDCFFFSPCLANMSATKELKKKLKSTKSIGAACTNLIHLLYRYWFHWIYKNSKWGRAIRVLMLKKAVPTESNQKVVYWVIFAVFFHTYSLQLIETMSFQKGSKFLCFYYSGGIFF